MVRSPVFVEHRAFVDVDPGESSPTQVGRHLVERRWVRGAIWISTRVIGIEAAEITACVAVGIPDELVKATSARRCELTPATSRDILLERISLGSYIFVFVRKVGYMSACLVIVSARSRHERTYRKGLHMEQQSRPLARVWVAVKREGGGD
jgi:hypothetical protein